MASPFAHLEHLLPWWTPWARPAVLVATTVLATGVTCAVTVWLARPRGGAHPRHWTEYARDRFPATRALGQSTLFPPAVFAMVGAMSDPGLTGMSRRGVAAWLLVTSLLTAHMLLYVQIWRLGRLPVVEVLRAQLVDVLVRRLPLVLMVVLLLAAPTGPRAPVVVGLGWTAITAAMLGGGLLLARWLGLARPGTGVLAIPEVLVVPGVAVNAFAYQTLGRIVFTSAAVAKLPAEQLLQILAHERGHLSEPTRVKLTRLLVLPYVCILAALFPLLDWFGVLGVAGALVIAAVPLLFMRRLALRMETRADHEAHVEDDQYAVALEAVYRHNATPMVLDTGTHPSLYDRLTALGAQPAYPRPDPPARPRTWMLAVGVPALCGLGLLAIHPSPPQTLEAFPEAIARGAPPHWSAVQLGNRLRTDDPETARSLFRTAAALRPDSRQGDVGIAWTAAMLGDRDEAQAALARLDTGEPSADPWSVTLIEQARSALATGP